METSDRRTMVQGAAIAAGLLLTGGTVQAQEAGSGAKLIEAREAEVLALFKDRFKRNCNTNLYQEVALAIATWLGRTNPGYSGFWTGEMGTDNGLPTWQLCIVKR